MNLLKIPSLFLVTLFSSGLLFGEITPSQEEFIKGLPADQQAGIKIKINESNNLNEELSETFKNKTTIVERPVKGEISEKEKERSRNLIYGYDLFSSSPTTFASSDHIPVPSEYILGSGDELKINFYGSRTNKANSFVSRTGEVSVPLIGPVYVLGLSLDKAKELIKQRVKDAIIGADVSITLGEVKSIIIYVLGEAYKPGAYTVSSLSTVSNALYVSGGVSEIGSVRNIQIKRNGKLLRSFDLYDLLLKGDTSKDLRLRSGDVIFIPVISSTARTEGLTRSHLFEFKKGETVKDLLLFGGLVDPDSRDFRNFEYSTVDKVTQSRVRYSVKDLTSIVNLVLKNGDVILASKNSSISSGRVELKGEFIYPGFYSIFPGDRLSDVIERAGGLTSESYPYGTIFTRKNLVEIEKKSYIRAANDIESALTQAITTPGNNMNIQGEGFKPVLDMIFRLRNAKALGRMIIDYSPLKVKENPLKDIVLMDGDVMFMPMRSASVNVSGEVMMSASINFEPGKNANYYINNSGGYTSIANRDQTFIVYPDGRSKRLSNSRWSPKKVEVQSGSLIIVPRDAMPLNGIVLLRELSPVVTALATSIAAFAVIGDRRDDD